MLKYSTSQNNKFKELIINKSFLGRFNLITEGWFRVLNIKPHKFLITIRAIVITKIKKDNAIIGVTISYDS